MRDPRPTVAIVGIGGIFPDALDLPAFWDNIRNCRTAFRQVPAGRWGVSADSIFDPMPGKADCVYSKYGCFIDHIPSAASIKGLAIDPGILEGLDPLFHLLIHAGKRAFDDAVTSPLNRSRVGVIVGNLALPSETSSLLTRNWLGRTFEEQLLGSPSQPSPTSPLNRFVTGLPAAILAQSLSLGGGSCTLDAACASSLYAIKLSIDELLSGRSDAMLTGGVSRPDPLFTQMGFSQLRALSKRGVCSPFDVSADGLVVGEGAGLFLLKRTEDALLHGDHIYGIIRGIGLSNDVGGSLLAPSSEGQLRAMQSAYKQAGWNPADVDLIECHATGTEVGDAVEVTSLKELWGDVRRDGNRTVIGSVKSNIGHLLTAAGGAALMKVLLSLKNRTLPPTANFKDPQPGMNLEDSPFRVLQSPETWQPRGDNSPRRAAVSAFGFGGINAHLLLEEWAPLSPPAHMQKNSNNTPIAVVGMAARFGSWLSLKEFQERALGGKNKISKTAPKHWHGAEKCKWFQQEGLDKTPFSGFYMNEVSVPTDLFRIPPREMEEMLPQQLLMLQTAGEALKNGGIGKDDNLNAGVFIGIAIDMNSSNFTLRWYMQSQAEKWAKKLGRNLAPEELAEWVSQLRSSIGPSLTANRTMGALGSVVASRIAREFRIGGPGFTISNNENSGIRALEAAFRQLQNGELDRALVGAVDLAGEFRSVLARHAISPFSSFENGHPFDLKSDGTAVGEGACAVVLKRLEDAERDGDRIYAVVKGIGIASGNSDTKGEFVCHSALERAYSDAAVPKECIGFIETSSDGTPKNDLNEIASLNSFFVTDSTTARSCAVSSIKGDIGDSGAAGGLASFMRACLALYQEIIPGCRGMETPLLTPPEDSRLHFPVSPRYWLRNRLDGPRYAGVNVCGTDGSCSHVVLEGYDRITPYPDSDRLAPLGIDSEFLFALSGESADELLLELDRLNTKLRSLPDDDLYTIAAASYKRYLEAAGKKYAISLVARDMEQLSKLIALGQSTIKNGGIIPDTVPAMRDRLFYSTLPLGLSGKTAFVFPGSGNHYPSMGMDLFSRWPDILRRQDSENLLLKAQFQPELFWNGAPSTLINNDHRAVIFGQVATGCAVSDLAQNFGIHPSAVIGYSLGESAGLFSQRAWQERDEMYTRMKSSTLFTSDLAGECLAVRKSWGLSEDQRVNWSLGVIEAPESEVRKAIPLYTRTYLLIVNTPNECVIGGDSEQLSNLADALGGRFFELQGVTTVHCEVAEQVAAPYHDLHLFNTNPPAGVIFYSGVKGSSYEVTRENAADSILGQALHGINFPKVIESAYQDGVRFFLEMGPGASCSRMIDSTLGDRPHLARSACYSGQDQLSTMLRFLASLIAERMPVDLTPLFDFPQSKAIKIESTAFIRVTPGGEPFHPPQPPVGKIINIVQLEKKTAVSSTEMGGSLISPDARMIQQLMLTQKSHTEAHAAFLTVSESIAASMAQALALEISLRQAMGEDEGSNQFKPPLDRTGKKPVSPPYKMGGNVAFNRDMCLEYARGFVGRMLGDRFAEVDSFPTRVRLPDEPLMLVDRIISVEGEPKSMAHGRVVTEHDIHPDAWYLDGGHIPTCIAVEAGQADLFLSGYLGIDFITRGLAVYRLLDAVVTFHRGLPLPGETIHYDIHIERFFRQGETWLFNFFFEATVNDQPLLSMRDGCAGFFTQKELDAGMGIVRPALDIRPTVGVRPANWRDLAPMGVESYDASQLDRLRDGDLSGCFGKLFAGLPLSNPLTIPGGRMRLVHRVTQIDPKGGRCGIGMIRAEADIHPDDWFITCHFVDDRVMPGTLMYECCMHTLRIYLLRMGWVAESGRSVWEPVPGVASKLCCRGQVLESTKIVTYEVTIREIGYCPEPYIIVDALMYADGKAIVEITSMSARLTGTTREKLEAMWSVSPALQTGENCDEGIKPALYTKEQILAYSNGKPSEGFGERYRVFDSERKIARLPGPPFQFIDRVTAVDGKPWEMVAGARVESQYDLPKDAWFFEAERQGRMPFSVLLEVALQPCGWLAAYTGSALASQTDVSFRNLGGRAVQQRIVTPDNGVLTCSATMKKVATSGGMIIQEYDFTVADRIGIIYEGDTMFGFFAKDALANQVGIRDLKPYQLTAAEKSAARTLPYPKSPPLPGKQLRMIDRIEQFIPNGGPNGLGYICGVKEVNPDEWFFKAHFFEDPVTPGSLGLESFIQLVKFVALELWGWRDGNILSAVALNREHRWLYRGQVVPTNREVTVTAWITKMDEQNRILTADGFLSVDGKLIYQMNDFTVTMENIK